MGGGGAHYKGVENVTCEIHTETARSGDLLRSVLKYECGSGQHLHVALLRAARHQLVLLQLGLVLLLDLTRLLLRRVLGWNSAEELPASVIRGFFGLPRK